MSHLASRPAPLVRVPSRNSHPAQALWTAMFAVATVRRMNAAGAAQLARYDPPSTLPFMRRNEILTEVK